MTWPQVAMWSKVIQLYHLDLATRIITGKSAVASDEKGTQSDRSWMHKPASKVSPEEAKKIANAELGELAQLGLGGIAVKFTGAA